MGPTVYKQRIQFCLRQSNLTASRAEFTQHAQEIVLNCSYLRSSSFVWKFTNNSLIFNDGQQKSLQIIGSGLSPFAHLWLFSIHKTFVHLCRTIQWLAKRFLWNHYGNEPLRRRTNSIQFSYHQKHFYSAFSAAGCPSAPERTLTWRISQKT